MPECSYTGDLQLQLNDGGNWDFNFINGQPCMTDGLDSAVILSVFGEPDTWQNGITNNPSEKYISEFPEIVKRGTVSDKTRKDGIQAIKRALRWMIVDGVAQDVDAEGEAYSVYGIVWTIIITRGNITSRYSINWNRGEIQINKEMAV
jgi:hypothetical protein